MRCTLVTTTAGVFRTVFTIPVRKTAAGPLVITARVFYATDAIACLRPVTLLTDWMALPSVDRAVLACPKVIANTLPAVFAMGMGDAHLTIAN